MEVKRLKKIAIVVKTIAEKMANVNFGSASVWSLHQPKEPKSKK